MDEDGAFDDGVGLGGAKRLEERWGGGVILVDLDAAEDLQAGLVGVVHEEERDAGVVLEVAEGDVLLVAAQVGEGDQLWIDDVDEALRAAAMLDVGLAGLAD